jgi:hypothetical protein
LFANVEVEEINSSAVDFEASVPNIYIMSNSVEFRPRYWTGVVLVREGLWWIPSVNPGAYLA